MMTNTSPMFLCCVSVVMFAAVSCSKPANENPSKPTSPETTSDGTAQDDDTSESNQPSKAASKTICETITSVDLKKVTGNDFPASNSTADFTNIKHCEFSSEDRKFVIGVLIAFDKTAKERMEQNKQFPNLKSVADFEDEANWEPVRGAFTALSGNKCVEIQVSTGHGDAATRLKFAQAIAKLVLERY